MSNCQQHQNKTCTTLNVFKAVSKMVTNTHSLYVTHAYSTL